MKKNINVPILFLPCFLAGILVANWIGQTELLQSGRLNEYYVSQLAYTGIDSGEYFGYLLGQRGRTFGLLALLSYTWMGLPAFLIVIGWYGFSLGYLFVNALVSMGFQGMLFIVVSLLPQLLCYVPALFFLLQSMRADRHKPMRFLGMHLDGRTGRVRCLILAVGLLAAGIWLEAYVNPMMLKNMIRYLNI